MKKLKRVLAVLLTAIMTLAMATTAFAAAPQKGSLTVTVNANNTLEGQTIKVYKLFDLSVSRKSYNYVVNGTYKTTIAKALGLVPDSASEKLYEKLVSYANSSAEIQKFADDFTAEALKEKIAETKSSGKLGQVSEYKFTDLDYGYYLVYQTGTKELQSSLVTVDELEKTVNLKGEAPSIEKTADKETVEIGQVVTYTIKGIIPDTTGYDSYVYKIKDTLSNGLDFVKNAQGEAQVDTDYVVSVQIKDGASSTPTATLSGDNNRTMTLDLSQWIRDNQASKGQEFTVTYYAKVNANAVVTEKNSASLEYGNDQSSTTTTKPSEAKTPTYPLQIHKLIRGQNSSYLADATFRLYKTEQDAKDNTNPIAVTGFNGSYTVDPTSQSYDMVSVDNGTTVGAGMNLKLNGLAAGDYWLVETKAPDGYSGITAPIKITITKSGDTEVDNWTISKDSKVETDKIIDIENSAGTILPGTGGMGTILFTVVGAAFILVIAASFVISRRKRA
ncbi:MAG: SpaH/EbpB family LPXTG-anchored major pilin [Blautia sp.]